MSASAIVKVTLRVILSQPWGDEAKVGDIIKAAKLEAKQAITRLLKDQPYIEQCQDSTVKVIYEEGR
jgi:hypothetical protein